MYLRIVPAPCLTLITHRSLVQCRKELGERFRLCCHSLTSARPSLPLDPRVPLGPPPPPFSMVTPCYTVLHCWCIWCSATRCLQVAGGRPSGARGPMENRRSLTPKPCPQRRLSPSAIKMLFGFNAQCSAVTRIAK